MPRNKDGTISFLEPDEVFVFGSNLAGRHGKGAALDAVKFGARYGYGQGLEGQSYAIPTKSFSLEILNLEEIRYQVTRFLWEADNKYPNMQFLVTDIGCGLAGYTPADIAPMFHDRSANVHLSENFLWVLGQDY